MMVYSRVGKLALDGDANALFLLQIEPKISTRRLSDLHSHFGQVINRIGLIFFRLVQSPYQFIFRSVSSSCLSGSQQTSRAISQ